MAFARYGHLPPNPGGQDGSFSYHHSQGFESSPETPDPFETPAPSREPSRSRSVISARSSLSKWRGRPPSGFYDKWIRNWWLAELICATIGTGLIVALIIILKKYDDQQTPQLGKVLGSRPTLNTIVSLLSTFAKAALAFTISSCLGQLKWIWYAGRYRLMHDLEVFDRASRGAYGAFGLIWTLKFRQIGVLGAVLMIFSVFIDPLAQQLVVYNSKAIGTDSSDAHLPIQSHWQEAATDVRTFASPENFDTISPTTKGAVQSGLWNGNVSVDDVRPICNNASNCTWPLYQSLAVCYSWTDVSSSIVYSNLSKQYFSRAEFWNLSQHHHVLNAAGTNYFNVSSVAVNADYNLTGQALNFDESIAYKDLDNPIADVFIMYLNGTTSTSEKPTYSAIEFVLQWCVQTFNTTFIDGKASTTRVEDRRDFTATPDPNSPGDFLSLDLQPDPDGQAFSIDYPTHLSLQRYVWDTLQGNMVTPNNDTTPKKDWIWYCSTDTAQLMFEPFNVFETQHAGLTSGQGTNQTGMDIMLKNVATSMTNHLRQTNPDTIHTGTLYITNQVVKVRWDWFIGPIIFTVACLVFLTTTIIYQAAGVTAKGTWKTSSLSVLHAANPDLQNLLQGMKYPSEMTSQSKKAYIQLVDEAEGGWRLWAQKPSTYRL